MRGIKDERRAHRARIIVQRVLVRAKRKGWSEEYTAQVVVASLAPNRVALGVVGPCFYCFDDLAATVDHLIPVSQGGTDEWANLVSCCFSCNSLKNTTGVVHFLAWYPFGKDRDRALRLRQRNADSPDYRRFVDEWIALREAQAGLTWKHVA